MRLNEIALEKKKEMQKWIKSWIKPDFGAEINITADDSISFSGDITVKFRGNETKLQYRFGECEGDLTLGLNVVPPITTLENCPPSLGPTGAFNCEQADNLKSLKHVPKCAHIYAGWSGLKSIKDIFPHLNSDLETLNINGTKVYDFRGVHELCKHKIKCLELEFDSKKTKGGIGLILIPGLKKIDIGDDEGQKARPAAEIIRKYVGRPDDIFECQAELIEAGLDRFAEL